MLFGKECSLHGLLSPEAHSLSSKSTPTICRDLYYTNIQSARATFSTLSPGKASSFISKRAKRVSSGAGAPAPEETRFAPVNLGGVGFAHQIQRNQAGGLLRWLMC